MHVFVTRVNQRLVKTNPVTQLFKTSIAKTTLYPTKHMKKYF